MSEHAMAEQWHDRSPLGDVPIRLEAVPQLRLPQDQWTPAVKPRPTTLATCHLMVPDRSRDPFGTSLFVQLQRLGDRRAESALMAAGAVLSVMAGIAVATLFA